MRFTVGRKLWAGFLTVLVFLIIVGGAGFWSLSSTDNHYRLLIDDRIQKVLLLERLGSIQSEITGEMRGYLLLKDGSHLMNRMELSDRSEQTWMELEGMDWVDSNRALLSEMKDAYHEYIEIIDAVLIESSNGKFENALATIRTASQNEQAMQVNISELIQNETAQMEMAEKDIQGQLKYTRVLILAIIGLATALSIFIAIIIGRSIARPVGKMTSAITGLAGGNLTMEPVKINNKDEIGEMAKAYNEMSEDLHRIISRARDTSIRLALQAEELSASSEESLAASEMVAEISGRNLTGSDEQVAIVNEATFSMQEMLTGINRITEDNKAMLHSSEEVSRLVTTGSTFMESVTDQMNMIDSAMGQSSEMMGEMAEHSKSIRNVTSLITAIAEQTNLLALNAAIEAARAGEHGKGFAVVAEEVRNLAEQSKKSAEEIGQTVDTMIKDMNRVVESTEEGNLRVKEGLTITEQTSDLFKRIEFAELDVAEKVATVSAAVDQIRIMTDEVAGGTTKVQELAVRASEEAQSTSAATEEQLAANEQISANAQVLAELAEKLQLDMEHFKV